MQSIDKIASKFLGKDGFNNRTNIYKVAEQIDRSLLLAIPRIYNRKSHSINAKIFEGFDIWNCYEISTLNAKGRPFVGIMKISFPASSKNIVESKSLKLYLNSFNLHHLKSVCNNDLRKELERIVVTDLRKHIGDDRIELEIYNNNSLNIVQISTAHNEFINIDSLDIEISNTTKSPTFSTIISKSKANYLFEISNQSGKLKVHSALLRSNCRVTNQPDWGDIYIYIKAVILPSKESLLRYITSMRKEQHFHEEICEKIYNDLYQQFKPTELLVQCLYTRRGGIDINPIRFTKNIKNNYLLEYFSKSIFYKTSRQ